jgi:flagellar FliJ protein
MRFRYPLQKIVDLKGSEKSMAEWQYAASLGQLRNEEKKLGELLAERKRAEDQMANLAASSVTLAELTNLQLYLEALDVKIRMQEQGVKTAELLVQERRKALADKTVEEKVWLTAREKAYEKFRYEMLVMQQNELDELAMVRYVRARA